MRRLQDCDHHDDHAAFHENSRAHRETVLRNRRATASRSAVVDSGIRVSSVGEGAGRSTPGGSRARFKSCRL